MRNKAQRSELRLALLVGLDRDEDDRIVLCPDEEVRHTIDRVFCSSTSTSRGRRRSPRRRSSSAWCAGSVKVRCFAKRRRWRQASSRCRAPPP
jgi:hypothetical protein